MWVRTMQSFKTEVENDSGSRSLHTSHISLSQSPKWWFHTFPSCATFLSLCLLHHQLMILYFSGKREAPPPPRESQLLSAQVTWWHSLLSSQWWKWPSSMQGQFWSSPAVSVSLWNHLSSLTCYWFPSMASFPQHADNALGYELYHPFHPTLSISQMLDEIHPQPPLFSFKVEAIQVMLFPYTQLLIWGVAGAHNLAIQLMKILWKLWWIRVGPIGVNVSTWVSSHFDLRAVKLGKPEPLFCYFIIIKAEIEYKENCGTKSCRKIQLESLIMALFQLHESFQFQFLLPKPIWIGISVTCNQKQDNWYTK